VLARDDTDTRVSERLLDRSLDGFAFEGPVVRRGGAQALRAAAPMTA
jgi:hypothetical protein